MKLSFLFGILASMVILGISAIAIADAAADAAAIAIAAPARCRRRCVAPALGVHMDWGRSRASLGLRG